MRQKGLLYVAFSSTLRVYEQSHTLQASLKLINPLQKGISFYEIREKVEKETFLKRIYEF